jgi:hypothetical protein
MWASVGHHSLQSSRNPYPSCSTPMILWSSCSQASFSAWVLAALLLTLLTAGTSESRGAHTLAIMVMADTSM